MLTHLIDIILHGPLTTADLVGVSQCQQDLSEKEAEPAVEPYGGLAEQYRHLGMRPADDEAGTAISPGETSSGCETPSPAQ
jgi:hypothetical protein